MSSSSSIPTVTITKREIESKWKDLLGATLEAWAHMILYVRRVYPEESFTAGCCSCGPSSSSIAGSNSSKAATATALFGLRLHTNRHPAVAAYIAEAIAVALPSLTSRVADAITLNIVETDPPPLVPSPPPPPIAEQPRYDVLSQAHLTMMDIDCYHDNDDTDEFGHGQQSSPDDDPQQQHHHQQEIIQPEPLVLEKYELRFPPPIGNSSAIIGNDHNEDDREAVYTLSAMEYLEREMRAILLSVIAMKDTADEDGEASTSDTVSFTISLHIPEADATCDVLDRAMAAGEWRTLPPPALVVDRKTTTTNPPKTPYVLRPLHTMDGITSPVGPVQFVVRYPRPVGRDSKRRRGGVNDKQRAARGRPKSHNNQTSLDLSSDYSQSTPTLDF